MAKGFKFPAPKGFAKGGMCSPKGAKAYAKGGPARGTNMEASDMYDPSDLRTLEAGQNVPRENKNRMRSESTQMGRAKADFKREYDDMYSFNPSRMMKSDIPGAYTKMRKAEDETGGYAEGGKVHSDAAMDKKLIKKMVKPSAMKMAEGGKAVMSAKMKGGRKFAKMADGGEVETEQMASKATRVKMPKGAKAPMGRAKSVPVAPRAPMIPPQAAPMAAGMAAPSPLARVARMGMKMGGKAKKY